MNTAPHFGATARILAALVLASLLTACGGGDPEPEPQPEPPENPCGIKVEGQRDPCIL